MATYELRPLSFGEILDGSFAIFRRAFGTLMTILIVCEGLPIVLFVYTSLAIGQGNFTPENLILLALAVLLLSLGGLLAAGAIVFVISESYLGREVGAGDALGFAVSKMGRLFVAGLAKYVIIIAAMFLLFFPAVIVACGYAVVTQIVVLEEISATGALGRSWELTKGHKWKALGLGVIIYILISIPGMATDVLALMLSDLEVLLTVVGQVIGFALYPIIACAFTLFYYDLRVRKEAFDLEHLSRQLGLDAEPAGA